MKNENSTLKFKTNINCGGCVSKVSTALDAADGICHWDVDTTDKDKILMVHSSGISEQEVEQLVRNAGFKIEPVNSINEAPSCH